MPTPIVYFDIAGPDGSAQRAFYQSVFDWEIGPGASIAAASTGGLRGGLREDPPSTVLYLGVPDVDAALGAIRAAGGTVMLPRTVVPGVVTFALFRDPAGNVLGLAEQGSWPDQATG